MIIDELLLLLLLCNLPNHNLFLQLPASLKHCTIFTAGDHLN